MSEFATRHLNTYRAGDTIPQLPPGHVSVLHDQKTRVYEVTSYEEDAFSVWLASVFDTDETAYRVVGEWPTLAMEERIAVTLPSYDMALQVHRSDTGILTVPDAEPSIVEALIDGLDSIEDYGALKGWGDWQRLFRAVDPNGDECWFFARAHVYPAPFCDDHEHLCEEPDCDPPAWLECEECDAGGWVQNCGHRDQPRPIASENGRLLCSDCVDAGF